MAVRPADVTTPGGSTPAVGPEVLAAALSASPAGHALLDEQGRCVYVNPAACALLGVAAEELLGRPLPFEDGGPAPHGSDALAATGAPVIASWSSAADRSPPAATAAR